MKSAYDTSRRDFPVRTPLTVIEPSQIGILRCSSTLLAHYQTQMSKAIWRPAPGRKLGFLVTQGDILLGLIFLASPIIRLKVRDEFLFGDCNGHGAELRNYMDMAVCVSTQPLGWYWNLGKLLALIAPTLGDYVNARYSDDDFQGVTTTALWGKSIQYNRIYKLLGYTKGYGHEHIDDATYAEMCAYLKEYDILPSCQFGDGSNARMRRIAAYRRATGDEGVTLVHGHVRGVYYHPAVPPEHRQSVIDEWYRRWGRPRYERLKNEQPPYDNGLTNDIDFADPTASLEAA